MGSRLDVWNGSDNGKTTHLPYINLRNQQKMQVIIIIFEITLTHEQINKSTLVTS